MFLLYQAGVTYRANIWHFAPPPPPPPPPQGLETKIIVLLHDPGTWERYMYIVGLVENLPTVPVWEEGDLVADKNEYLDLTTASEIRNKSPSSVAWCYHMRIWLKTIWWWIGDRVRRQKWVPGFKTFTPAPKVRDKSLVLLHEYKHTTNLVENYLTMNRRYSNWQNWVPGFDWLIELHEYADWFCLQIDFNPCHAE